VTLVSNELAEIIVRAQRNDQWAYEQIYNRYVDALYRYLYARCGNAAMAEEALGELWLRVVQHLPRFRVPADGADQAFSAWLYRIARNLLVDMQRSHRFTAGDIPASLAAPTAELDAAVQQRDEHRQLVDAVNRLTADQREVILLRFHGEMTSAEVAQRTGRSETAVKALQHRALAALARTMGIKKHRDAQHGTALNVEQQRYP
jgi:RNA polymerase sigma-70 factor, ECF subfamily